MPAVDKLNSDAVIPNGKEPKVLSTDGSSRSRFVVNTGDDLILNVSNSDYVMIYGSNFAVDTDILTEVSIDDVHSRDEDGRPATTAQFDRTINPDMRWIEAVDGGNALLDPSIAVAGEALVRYDTRGISALKLTATLASAVDLTVRY